MVKCILMYFNLFQDQIYLRTPIIITALLCCLELRLHN